MPVSSELIVQALHLPLDTVITGGQYDIERDVFVFVVEHDDLKEVPSGYHLATVIPKLRRYEYGNIEFMGWGQ